jgi:WD40 repeat protein
VSNTEHNLSDDSWPRRHTDGDLGLTGSALARAIRVHVMTPGLLLGFIAFVSLYLFFWNESQKPPAEPGLPRWARVKIQGDDGIVGELAFHPSGQRLFSGDALTGRVQSWDPASGLLKTRFAPSSTAPGITAMALPPDGRLMAVGIHDQGIVVCNTESGSPPSPLVSASRQTSALAFTPDGRELIAAGWDGTIRVWETSTWNGRIFWSSQAEGGWSCLVLSPDGRTLAAGGKSGWSRIWDLASGRSLVAIEGDGSSFRCVAYSPDGQFLAAGSWKGRIRMWETASYQERLGPSQVDLSSVVCLAFAPDGRTLATGHEDHVVRLWETSTSRLLREFRGHGHGVRSLAFSPDGRSLASGAADSTIFLWDTVGLPARVH